MDSITATELKTKLDTGEQLLLLDVRESWEYELCSIEGSVNIEMQHIDKIENEIKPENETIVICHHGMRSFQVASYLESKGFTKITNLEGGVDAWARTVDTAMEQY